MTGNKLSDREHQTHSHNNWGTFQNHTDDTEYKTHTHTLYAAIYQAVKLSASLDSITANRHLACASSAAQIINSMRITGKCKIGGDMLKQTPRQVTNTQQ